MNAHRPSLARLLMTGALGVAAACGAARNTSSNPPPSGQGQLAIALVDAPPDKASEIWVTITQVTAHTTSGGWSTIPMGTSPLTLDLMKLQASALDLGLVNLPAGTTITQVRLYVDPAADKNWVVLADGSKVPLKVPSGSESGIKIHGPWQISECNRTALTLDFDGKKSIFSHPAEQGTEWILRPVIMVKKAETVNTGCSSTDGGVIPTTCDLAAPHCDDLFVCTAVGDSAACLGSPGAPCTDSRECLVGSCDSTNHCQGGIGSSCSSETPCAVGTCVSDTCQKGTAGAPCGKDEQCASDLCVVGTCAGTSCAADGECASDWCNHGTCEETPVGKPCSTELPCPSEYVLSCVEGNCQYTQ